ncbi:hypothetical protein AB0873_16390 [Micromonospora sp. NPDC047707]|uniref:hypothetical protein n=1 Tax=Micromonospora sp. NPDC047707 TaxID=3154498 RepID=UPI0034547A85
MSETGQTDRVTAVPDKLNQWHDFRKSVALVSMVLFFLCLVGLGFLAYQLVIVGDDRGVFNPWSFLRFMSVTVPLGVAAVTGVGVFRAVNNAESKRRGRIMSLALLVAAVMLVVTGVIKDRLS